MNEPSSSRERIAPAARSGAFISEKVLKDCLHACLACQLASVLCAELGLTKNREEAPRRWTALSLECAGACANLAQTLLRGVLSVNVETLRLQLVTCASACASSAAECSYCAESCLRCRARCVVLLRALDGDLMAEDELLSGT